MTPKVEAENISVQIARLTGVQVSQDLTGDILISPIYLATPAAVPDRPANLATHFLLV